MNQSKSMLKIVVVGGGNGTAITLNALKKLNNVLEISAVVSMSDSGGSTGRLRDEFNTLPPGDVMRAVLAMSPFPFPILKKIFYKNRFENVGKLDKHNLGNLFLVLGEQYGGDYVQSVRALEQAVDAVGHVYPVTLQVNDLVGELDNGEIIKTEGELDQPKYDKNLRIKKVWLEPEAKIYEDATKVLEQADYIIFGPGSLYTSIVATTLAKGFKEAVEKSNAKLIYIAGNARHDNGETGPKKVSEAVRELQSYLPRNLDSVVCNNHKLSSEEKDFYNSRGWETVPCDVENCDCEVVQGDFERKGGGLCDEKLSDILKNIIKKG
ncbi:MAG: gluconeogenesis factor YvcK family protein [Candidatus Magasanikbacteria bacterium]